MPSPSPTLPHRFCTLRGTSRFERFWGGLFWIVLILLFGPAMVRSEIPAFRDTLHFYFPLWHFIAQQPLDYQLVPQWNPFDRLGVSLIIEPTTGSFYPLRGILLIPFLSVGQRTVVFCVVHLFLCYAGALRVGKDYRLDRVSRQVLGFSYALAGPLFFQIYNPVFLVSAAWLPFAWSRFARCVASPTKQARNLASLELSVFLALIILGGDPQTALHCLFVFGVAILLPSSIMPTALHDSTPYLQRLSRDGCRLLVSGCLTVLLASVQILPTAWQLLHQGRGLSEGEQFEFSVAPWHWLTMLFPNLLGSFVKQHSRWVEAIPWEPRMWVPSLHLGLVSLLAIIAWARFTRGPSRLFAGLLLLIVMLSASGSWGILQHLWNFLPGYSQFRYPAKWLTLVVWLAALLASQGFRFLLLRGYHRQDAWIVLIPVTLWAIASSVSLALLSPWGNDQFMAFCQDVAPDPLCGSLDLAQARLTILISLWSTTLTASIGWLIWRCSRTRWWKANLLLLLLVVELTFSAWLNASFLSSFQLIDTAQRRALPNHWLDQAEQAPMGLRQASQHFAKFHLLVPVRNEQASLTLDSISAGGKMTTEHAESDLISVDPTFAPRMQQSIPGANLSVFYSDWNTIEVEIHAIDDGHHAANELHFALPGRGWLVEQRDDASQSWQPCTSVADRHCLHVQLPPGIQHLRLRYQTPGLMLGMFITLATGIALGIIRVWHPLLRSNC